MGRIKIMPDGSKGLARFQVFEKRKGEDIYHLAFDTRKIAKKYIKKPQGKILGKLIIRKRFI